VLAYANGANDNFKGVATLFGSGITGYRAALTWATICTALGSILALVLAQELLAAFSGRGLVPAAIVGDPRFPLAVGFGAGTTVLIAAFIGMPISTTHALIGALVGAGAVRSPQALDFGELLGAFLLPLLTSPFLAVAAAALVYPLLRMLRRLTGATRQTCICVGSEIVAVLDGQLTRTEALERVTLPTVAVDTEINCKIRYSGSMLGVSVGRVLDIAHFLSAGAVSFARGLNDTPKIAALLLTGSLVSGPAAISLVAAAIALGGLLNARRVAETMSHRITQMSPGQGLCANTVTAAMVIGASNLGLPVSTTHVSCGALFGIGATTRQARWGTIGQIVLAWVATLPVAGVLAAALSALL
jgi:inorganic phosphate transporter, PiT family